METCAAKVQSQRPKKPPLVLQSFVMQLSLAIMHFISANAVLPFQSFS